MSDIRTIIVKYPVNDLLNQAMDDFRDITNHLIAYALHHRIESAFDLRDQNYEWFAKNYTGKYASHYLHSASSYAMGIVKSWREVGQAKQPHLCRPVAKLDQMLVNVKAIDDFHIKLQITIAPRQFVVLDLPIHHKKFAKYRQHKLGEITIHPDCIDLPFQTDETKTEVERLAGIDLNFDHADIATSDGEIKIVDLKPITDIQKHSKRKRESVQKSIPTNLQKQRKILKRHKNRERNRITDVINKKSKEILDKTGHANIIFEDLKTTTHECLKDAYGKKHRAKLCTWAHGKLQTRVALDNPYKTKHVYARGTSSKCAFDGSKVTHPEYHLSNCKTHGTLDRDKNASVNILVRGAKFLRRENPFPASVMTSLLKQSVPGDDEARTLRTGHENRYDAMTGDVSNFKAKFYEPLP